MGRVLAVILAATAVSAQTPARVFEAASVKPSKQAVGPDANNKISIGPASVSARNATLKGLIGEAYTLPSFQITGGPTWINSSEYDIDARAGAPASSEDLRRMLQSLLADRFRLAVHRESREQQVYELSVDKGGPKLKPENTPGFGRTLTQFAEFLSIRLSISLSNDPSSPSRASGPPVPVLDKTGLSGVYDINVDVKPELGGDTFTLWQRALQDQLGLRLVSRKSAVEILVVDRAAAASSN